MAELRKCSRCKSLITLEHYSLNRKDEYFKCCDNCRKKSAEYIREYRPKWDCEIICDHCGDRTTKNCKSIHKRRFWCQTSKLTQRPRFEEWLAEQDYDKLLWEYKQLLKDETLLKEYATQVNSTLDKLDKLKNKQILSTTTHETDSGSGSSYITDSGSGSSYYTESE